MATCASTQRLKQKGAGQGSQIGHALVESPTGLIVDEAVKATVRKTAEAMIERIQSN
jgi:hypothetical protein